MKAVKDSEDNEDILHLSLNFQCLRLKLYYPVPEYVLFTCQVLN